MFVINKMNIQHHDEVISMMQEFYSSEAVFTNGSLKIFENDFLNCINDCPFIEGYVFKEKDEILGYAMLAKSFSTEFGKFCIWFEDLYIKPLFRGKGIVSQFIKQIKLQYPEAVFRLEVEKENEHAIHVYKKFDFVELPYMEMVSNC